MSTYRILSLDGGGSRGYLSILLLERLAHERPGFLEQFDLFAGTSTGSIIASGLAYGLEPADIRGLYEKHCRRIFHNPLRDKLFDPTSALSAKYSNKYLKRALKSYFGDKRLGDLHKKVLIATFHLDYTPGEDEKGHRMWKAKFFHNYPDDPATSQKDSDECEFIVDVVLRSCAAPLYFPSYQGYVDGFVVANNPSMCALAQAIKAKVAKSPNEIVILSVGTGLNLRYIEGKENDWGWTRWSFQLYPHSFKLYGLPLIYMMWEGGVNLANYQCKQLLGGRFHRLDPVLPKLIDIDTVRDMPLLKQVAQETCLDETLAWFDGQLDEQLDEQFETAATAESAA